MLFAFNHALTARVYFQSLVKNFAFRSEIYFMRSGSALNAGAVAKCTFYCDIEICLNP